MIIWIYIERTYLSRSFRRSAAFWLFIKSAIFGSELDRRRILGGFVFWGQSLCLLDVAD